MWGCPPAILTSNGLVIPPPETLNADNQDFGQKIQLSQKLPYTGKLALCKDSARFDIAAESKLKAGIDQW